MRLILTLIILLPLALQAQHKEEITKTLNEYLAHSESGDFLKSLDYMPDEFFNLVPRAQMEAMLTETFDNPDLGIAMQDGEIHEISNEVVHDDIRYATVDYQYTMTFTNKKESNTEALNMMKEYFAAQVGEENVRVDEEKQAIEVIKKSTMYAISKPDQGWRFIEKSSDLDQVIDQIIPAEVLEQL